MTLPPTLTVNALGALFADDVARETWGVEVVRHNGGEPCGLRFEGARFALYLDGTRVRAISLAVGQWGAELDGPVWYAPVTMDTVLVVAPRPRRKLTPEEQERRRVAAKRRRLGRMQMERTRRRSPTAPA